jgi:glycosyltransferase involved in cell wall biosynthesis
VKILRVHNHYQQAGGESAVHSAECDLLERAGIAVVRYERHNDEWDEGDLLDTASRGVQTVWSWDTRRELAALLDRERPDLAHFTNTFPLVSPSAFDACQDAGVPVVHSLHNYRLLCPAANLLRNGRACEECIDHSLWRSVRHGCYRGSRAATGVVAASLAVHRSIGTFARKVDAYLALTEFARGTFARGGLPAGRIHVKPNFVAPDPGERAEVGDYALFVGRLSEEKGLRTLIDAWQRLESPPPLRIAGDGPLASAIDREVRGSVRGRVWRLGALPRRALIETLRCARFLVVPSDCYEGFPLAIAEAFACGVPVIAAGHGAMAEIVDDGRTGLHFTPGSGQNLAEKVAWTVTNAKRFDEMGHAARAEYEKAYTAERNLEILVGLYEDVIDERLRRRG